MIVDFRIEKQSLGYAKPDILDIFYNGARHRHLSAMMILAAMKTPNDVKKDIMKKSLEEWKLLESIERVELEIDGLVKSYAGKLTFESDLQKYVADIKATVEVLMKA